MSWVFETCRYRGDLIPGGVAETVEPCPGSNGKVSSVRYRFLVLLIGKVSSVRLFRDDCLGLLLTIHPYCWIAMGLGQAHLHSSLN